MNPLRVLASAFLFAAVFSGCSHSAPVKKEETASFFGTTQVHRYKLPNGLKLLVLEDHSAPTFAYHTWFNVGSRDEDKGLTGLAHFFEHLMFKSTTNHPEGEFDRTLESAGAEGENAFTNRDYTGYVQSMPSDKLELIASLESDRMTNLQVIDASVNSEREVVQNERRFRKENSPDGTMYQKLYELAYNTHSYHWPVIGYDEDLVAAQRSQIESFYKRFYAPNNATVVVAGDVSPSRVLAVIEKFYGGLKSSPIQHPKVPREPEQTSERGETIKLKIAVEKLMLGYHATDVNSSDFPTLEVLRNVLSVGKSSRLYKKLVDSGIAASVGIDNADSSDPGMFIFFVNMQKGKSAKAAEEVIMREIKAVAQGKITPEEIKRAISVNRFTIFDDLASNEKKAHFLGYYETIAGRFERGVEVINTMSTVDKNALAAVAQKFLKDRNRTTVIGAPQ